MYSEPEKRFKEKTVENVLYAPRRARRFPPSGFPRQSRFASFEDRRRIPHGRVSGTRERRTRVTAPPSGKHEKHRLELSAYTWLPSLNA
jgi:hypothetical protein